MRVHRRRHALAGRRTRPQRRGGKRVHTAICNKACVEYCMLLMGGSAAPRWRLEAVCLPGACLLSLESSVAGELCSLRCFCVWIGFSFVDGRCCKWPLVDRKHECLCHYAREEGAVLDVGDSSGPFCNSASDVVTCFHGTNSVPHVLKNFCANRVKSFPQHLQQGLTTHLFPVGHAHAHTHTHTHTHTHWRARAHTHWHTHTHTHTHTHHVATDQGQPVGLRYLRWRQAVSLWHSVEETLFHVVCGCLLCCSLA